MNWQEYCALAARTESIPAICYGASPEEYPPEWKQATRLLHATLGLCTEIQEYTEATSDSNRIEELGDIYWYLAVLDNTFNIPHLSQLPNCDAVNNNGMHNVAVLQDICKRHIFYGRPLDNEPNKNYPHGMLNALYLAYWGIHRWIADEETDLDISIVEIMEANIRKLEKRYPDLRFDSEHSVNRDVENELSHIVPMAISEIADKELDRRAYPHKLPAPVEIGERYPDPGYDPAREVTNDIAMCTMDELSKGFKHLLLNEFTNLEALKIVSMMALRLANKYRHLGANCIAEGYKVTYIKLLDCNKLELLLMDAWYMYLELYKEAVNQREMLEDLQELLKGGVPNDA